MTTVTDTTKFDGIDNTSLTALAERDDVDAQFTLACRLIRFTPEMLDTVESTDANSARQAHVWLTRAAKHSHGDAMAVLGHCYVQGVGVATDSNIADIWLKRACDASSALGYLLSANYNEDLPDPLDAEGLAKYFEKAAESLDVALSPLCMHLARHTEYGWLQSEKFQHWIGRLQSTGSKNHDVVVAIAGLKSREFEPDRKVAIKNAIQRYAGSRNALLLSVITSSLNIVDRTFESVLERIFSATYRPDNSEYIYQLFVACKSKDEASSLSALSFISKELKENLSGDVALVIAKTFVTKDVVKSRESILAMLSDVKESDLALSIYLVRRIIQGGDIDDVVRRLTLVADKGSYSSLFFELGRCLIEDGNHVEPGSNGLQYYTRSLFGGDPRAPRFFEEHLSPLYVDRKNINGLEYLCVLSKVFNDSPMALEKKSRLPHRMVLKKYKYMKLTAANVKLKKLGAEFKEVNNMVFTLKNSGDLFGVVVGWVVICAVLGSLIGDWADLVFMMPIFLWILYWPYMYLSIIYESYIKRGAWSEDYFRKMLPK